MSNSGTHAQTATVEGPKRGSSFTDFFSRLLKEKPLGTVGVIVVLVLLVLGVFADLAWLGMPGIGLAPEGYNEIHLKDRMEPPSARYILGTDGLGRDELSRIIHGARISMIVGLGASAIATAIAAIIAVTSGYIGGRFDLIVQRFVDAWLCFPTLVLLLTAMAIIGPGIVQVTLVLGIASGIGSSRLVRSAVIAIRENVYIEAARAIGSSTPRILTRHVLPNVVPFLIIFFTVGMAGMIIGEASLSFLGFGVPPPQPSWGGMLSGEGRAYMLRAPWLALWPGLALTIVVYGINMFGDAVRDLLDPRLRGGVGRYGGVKMRAAKIKKPDEGQTLTTSTK